MSVPFASILTGVAGISSLVAGVVAVIGAMRARSRDRADTTRQAAEDSFTHLEAISDARSEEIVRLTSLVDRLRTDQDRLQQRLDALQKRLDAAPPARARRTT